MTEECPDLNFVDLHRLAEPEARVEQVVGHAWRIERGTPLGPLAEGHRLKVGETVAVAANSEVVAGPLLLKGGRRGRAHALVASSSFRPSPSRADVPRLLRQLAQIEREVGSRGLDPLQASQMPPRTAHERAHAAEFALLNLCLPAARMLPERLARELEAVVLFVSEETAFVAFSQVDVRRLRAVMEALERPVHTHLVQPEVIRELIPKIYGSS